MECIKTEPSQDLFFPNITTLSAVAPPGPYFNIEPSKDVMFPKVTTSSPTPPEPYYFSYEYGQIQEELTKLNDKIDTILNLFERKRSRGTISEANKKLDDILQTLDKKKRLEGTVE